MRITRVAAGCAIAALIAGGCTAGDDDTTGGSPSTTLAPGEVPTGPSPGVTDDAIRIGVTYADATALQAVGLSYDFGDVEGAYQAMADAINEDGGIDGRQIELAFAPIDPTSPAPADRACVRLTEDEDVFLVTGFFLEDAVLCPVDLHSTAVVGGQMTPERVEQAAAPWITIDADTDFLEASTLAFIDEGRLDGTVAVMAATGNEDNMDVVVGLLTDAGIDPVETAIMDAPTNDTTAVETSVRTIAERFESAGADQLVLVGGGGTNWLAALEDDPSYRPELRFTDVSAVTAFSASADTTDTSALDGALAAGGFGPAQAVYDEPKMTECIAGLEAAGVEVPVPDEVGDDPSNIPYAGAFLACQGLTLVRTWLEAAGDVLNYGALDAALQAGFDVDLPGEPGGRTYGPPLAADGDPPAYLYVWDESAGEMVPEDS